MQTNQLSKRQALIAWTLCCVLAGSIFLVYAFTSLTVGRGQYVMPLDDVYIHFQYAKQMALGQPYVYNPGQPPTSGATSFLYPFILAFGYLIGFQGLNLGIWAMSIGALALACSAYLMVPLARALNAPYWLALLGAAIFALTGAVSWHFMSGMETGLVTLFVLLTLYHFVRKNVRGVAISGTLLAMIRPEGGLLALIVVLLTFFEAKKDRYWLLLPILALGVQPMANLLFTGSMVATGNQAKSILGMIPFYWDEVIQRIFDNFMRMWAEFATGISPREGWYLPLGVSLFALIGWLYLIRQRETRILGILILAWLLIGTGAISTLDTAFWHFKRYQMPLIAFLFPLAMWGVGWLANQLESKKKTLNLVTFASLRLVCIFVLLMSVWTGTNFLRYYAFNVDYVYSQPLQMARWLDANTPPDATVAVHDVGMMRYMGNRTTIDMVGLTTPGAADAWRNGPGAVAEFLIQVRPDYIAAYTNARGLSYLAATGIYNYGNALVEFPVTVDMSANVALAAETSEVIQGIYQPNNPPLNYLAQIRSPQISANVNDLMIADYVNVGFVNFYAQGGISSIMPSEVLHNYHWYSDEQATGFPTEVYEFCDSSTVCILDGGRLITREESFTLHNFIGILTETNWIGHDVVLVTRLHPLYAGTFDVYVSSASQPEVLVDTQWIPQTPGQWLEIPTFIPSQYVQDEELHIRIVPHVPNGAYMSYYHWAYYGDYTFEMLAGEPVVAYQNGEIALMEDSLRVENSQLNIELTWQTSGNAQGDYIAFIHVYDDVTQPPIAQADRRPAGGALPIGNWLPGVLLDTMTVDLTGVPPGHYQVAIGMYDAVTLQNLHPDFGGDELGRVFIGEIEISEN